MAGQNQHPWGKLGERNQSHTQGSILTVGGQQGKARTLGGPQDGRGMQQPVCGGRMEWSLCTQPMPQPFTPQSVCLLVGRRAGCCRVGFGEWIRGGDSSWW